MILQDTEHRDTALVSALVAVWERSVRATHTFLTDDEINRIKQYVPQAIAEVPELAVMRPDSDSSEQTPLAFMGVADGRLEMLFVDPDHREHGVGKQLLDSRESFQTFPEYAILARATNSSTVHSHVVSLPQSGQNSTLCAKQAI